MEREAIENENKPPKEMTLPLARHAATRRTGVQPRVRSK